MGGFYLEIKSKDHITFFDTHNGISTIQTKTSLEHREWHDRNTDISDP
jgi:hypothetical protein